tara:strand:+ start:134 stop:526 length:393 start_codon:yes stop_codon:yes gene_type:complete
MKQNINKKQLREFGILIGFGFPLLIGWLIPFVFGHEFREWTLWIGIPGLLLGLIQPNLLLYPYKGWIILGHVLGWINSRLVLGLVFVFLVQPIAYIMRLFGYDPLRKKRNMQESYKEDKRGHQIDLTRIF